MTQGDDRARPRLTPNSRPAPARLPPNSSRYTWAENASSFSSRKAWPLWPRFSAVYTLAPCPCPLPAQRGRWILGVARHIAPDVERAMESGYADLRPGCGAAFAADAAAAERMVVVHALNFWARTESREIIAGLPCGMRLWPDSSRWSTPSSIGRRPAQLRLAIGRRFLCFRRIPIALPMRENQLPLLGVLQERTK